MGHSMALERTGSASSAARARHSRIRSVAFSVAVLLLAEAAKTPAAQLTLQTNTSAAAPLTISPWNSAGQLLVSVVNSVANDPASEWMTGWKISLAKQVRPKRGPNSPKATSQGYWPRADLRFV
jgi:hypothetical protein